MKHGQQKTETLGDPAVHNESKPKQKTIFIKVPPKPYAPRNSVKAMTRAARGFLSR
jgi:hypothetical protein